MKQSNEPSQFKLHSEYQPTGDQPQAIAELVEGFRQGNQFETLLGVTGSGKTFTMANVIQALNIKSDLDYSHIPIVLLTAKTTLQSKIDGLKSGADAYIEKPFSVEYLKVSVANLLSNHEKLHAAFAHSPFIQTNSMAMTKADETFLKTLNEVIVANMQNPDFCLDDMASLLNMSRSSLNRKIKGVLDMTPNDYIRLERLKKAAQLLREGECKVNEVCYMVGFNTPSYFTKCFQKQFGILPKDFVK